MSGGIFDQYTGYHNRQSIRLRGYDYSKPGAYFVTICINDRKQKLFGDISNGQMVENELAGVVHEWWRFLPKKYPQISTDEFIVMPNHVHGIIVIRDAPPTTTTLTLGNVVAFYKYQTTKQINAVCNNGANKIWQRNYYDRIIRDEKSLCSVRQYIRNNPSRWTGNAKQYIDGEINLLYPEYSNQKVS